MLIVFVFCRIKGQIRIEKNPKRINLMISGNTGVKFFYFLPGCLLDWKSEKIALPVYFGGAVGLGGVAFALPFPQHIKIMGPTVRINGIRQSQVRSVGTVSLAGYL
jgi:hypothetical protein